MRPVSSVAIFCEDLREEKSGQDSIIGTMPDNVNLPGAVMPNSSNPVQSTPMLPKLGLYLRMNLDAEEKPTQLSVRVIDAKGELIAGGGWEQHLIDKAFKDANENKMPFVGLIFKILVAPFPIFAEGKITAIATVNETDYVAGAINITFSKPTASTPPA